MSDRRADALRRYADRFGHDLGAVRARLLTGDKTPATQIAKDNGLPAAAGSGPATFFADFTAARGQRHIRVCGAAACTAASGGAHVGEVAAALGVPVNTCRDDGEVSLQEVRCLGYAGESSWSVWPEVISKSDPAGVLAEVDAARLRGRGGAGFPAARKWAAARMYPRPRVVVANGDEGDPGSYVDRLLLERDPDRVLEGLALAAFAVEAEQAVIFIRAEYPQAHERMRAAIRQAYRDGHFGRNVHGSGHTLEVLVESGAGSYVSGEETALLNAIEGLRGVVRPRPPYPVEHGLGGRPTVVNNVETLATVPWIIRHGGAAYARFGTADENGTVVACLSERFARPGAYEVEIGTPVRHLVEDLGGGLHDGAVLRSIQVGGPLGGFLGPGDLDLPLSEAALSARGAALGHAGIVAFDNRLSGTDILRHVWRFAAAESCGECSPCRVGAGRGLRLAEQATTTDVVRARADVLRTMATGSLCAFGRRVPAAIRSVADVYGLEGWR